MQLANTQTVRNIVNYIVNTSAHYTDKGANNTRLIAWRVSKHNANMYVKQVQDIFTLAGFSNRITVSTSKVYGREGGVTYLRINASYSK
jgi:hypothetical protein